MENEMFMFIEAIELMERDFLVVLQRILLLLREIINQNMAPTTYCYLNREQEIIKILLGDQWDMRKHIRVSQESFYNLLQLLSVERRSGWDLKFSLAVFLFWLACGTSYRVISTTFNIPKSTIHRMVHEILQEVLALSERLIRLPTNEELDVIGAGFGRMAGSEVLNCVVGAIDGCHVEVRVVGPNHADYFNRKLRYSIQFQAVCDHKGKFLHVFAGYPGSVHDSRVLRASPLITEGLYPPQGYVLLGDSGYPCIREPVAILTPYREPVAGVIQARYNVLHKRGRNIIERSFGMLKARWRCIFMQRIALHHTKVAGVIGACCIMHNICLTNGDDLLGEEEIEDVEIPVVENQQNGFQLRDQIAGRISQIVNVPQELEDHDYL